MESIFLPFILVILASLFQGSFGVGMKYMAPLKWEAWWLVHISIAMLLFPLTWAFISVPGLIEIISNAPSNAIQLAMFFGFLWGIGGIMFGVSIPFIGISLTYGIVMGLASSVGSLIPLFQLENATQQAAFPIVLMGVAVMLIGVIFTAIAGIQRDKLKNADNKSDNIVKGIIIASVSGVLSAFLNVGFANAAPIAKIAEASGVITSNSSLAAWVVVLMGAFVMNLGYAIFKLYKNRSWNSFAATNSGKAYLWAIIAGLCWFAALGVYGHGAALMGQMGPIIGWPMMLGLSLGISNIWAYRSGEWKGAEKPFKILLIGLLILIFASIILAYANNAR